MAPTRINLSQFRLGPEVPLGRRGRLVESSRTLEEASGWEDTYFQGAYAAGHYQDILRLYRDKGEDVFTVTKRIVHGPVSRADFPPILQDAVNQMLDLRVVKEDSSNQLLFANVQGDWGAMLECAVLIALSDLFIQGHRDVKIQYPYRGARYDPDGQKYDILAGLDISRLLWIECKKPVYLNGASDPLGHVLCLNYVKKFYRRAHYLKPSLAIFLVDTKEDYRSRLKLLFSEDFHNSGCFSEISGPGTSLIARLHGFIYFVRVEYHATTEYIQALCDCIRQVLHDSRHDWPQPGFSIDPFR